MSSKFTGSTHGSVAFSVSALAERLRLRELIPGFLIATDTAYLCENGVLTPLSTLMYLDENDGVYRDALNFYHISHRIHVEQAFEIFFQHWGLFKKLIECHIDRILPIVSAAMRLHNFANDQRENIRCSASNNLTDERRSRAAISAWWQSATASGAEGIEFNRGHRIDIETSYLRAALTQKLNERGITRPPQY